MSRDDPIRRIGRPTSWAWDEAADDDLVARFKAGERVKAIAVAFELPVYIVERRIEALRDQGRIPYRNRAWSPAETARLLAAIGAGGRFTELARIFGRSNGALREEARRARRALAKEREQADRDQYQMELRAA